MNFSIHQMIFSEKFANSDNFSNFANVKVVQNGEYKTQKRATRGDS